MKYLNGTPQVGGGTSTKYDANYEAVFGRKEQLCESKRLARASKSASRSSNATAGAASTTTRTRKRT